MVVVKLHDQKHNLNCTDHQGMPGQELKLAKNLEAGVDAEAMKELCLLACSSKILCVCVSVCVCVSPGIYLPTIDGLSPINHCPTTLPTVALMEASSQMMCPPLR